MSNQFLKELNEKHLCSWYILPLLDLNITAFGSANFINGFQVKNSSLIAVQVLDTNLCLKVLTSPYYKQTTVVDKDEFILFQIPEEWKKDYILFLEGKYSRMSENAKVKIRELSGLKYNYEDEQGNKIIDAILMALDNHRVLREKWKEMIGTNEFWLPEESLSLLNENSFITIENL